MKLFTYEYIVSESQNNEKSKPIVKEERKIMNILRYLTVPISLKSKFKFLIGCRPFLTITTTSNQRERVRD